MNNQQIIRTITSTLFFLMFLPSCTAHTEVKMENIDTSYSTGSAKTDKELKKYIEGAKHGSPFAHAYLGKVYCGEICLRPRPDANEDEKAMLKKYADSIKAFKVNTDYIKAYAHYSLSDNFKGNYSDFTDMLEKYITKEQVETAKKLVGIWKQQEEKYQENLKGGK